MQSDISWNAYFRTYELGKNPKKVGPNFDVPPKKTDFASKRVVILSDVKDGLEDSLMFVIIEKIIVFRLLGRTRLIGQSRHVMNMHYFPHTIEEYACDTSIFHFGLF